MITDFIQGEKFEQLAHFVYSPMHLSGDDYSRLENTFDVSKLFPNCIVYTHSMYAKNLLGILKDVKTPIVLITHNGDTNITPDYEIPECVVKWFAQNVAMTHPKIQSIPIGLENSRWYPKLKKREVMQDYYNQYTGSVLRHSKLVYMNHNVKTNPKERQFLYDHFSKEPWVTSEEGKNGVNFNGYVESLCSHSFVFCPEGNGIDTHRTWEALYMGCIPIEKRNLNNQYYQELPILFVDSWEDVTEKYLQTVRYIVSLELAIHNPYRMLTFTYWERLIRSYSKTIFQ